MDREAPGTDQESLSLMTYSHDGYGLGHLRRNSIIAARFVREIPHSTALMLTGCPVGNVFLLPKGVDFIKVPSLIKVDTGVYNPQGLRIGRHKAKAIRASTIQSAATQFQPDVVLVDHVPAGVYGELLPTLMMLKQLDNPPVIVLGLRDIIDEPSVVCDLWRREKTYETIREYYDEVLIYGHKDVFDAASHYGMSAEFPGRVTYSGYVCSEEPLKARDQVREDLRLLKDKLVVVAAGGGHDAYPLMQSCMEACQLLGKDAPFDIFFITGPLMDLEQREQLRAEARGLGIRVITAVEDTPSFINAADLVITMGGYNTLCEAISFRRKALVVPRLGPRAEQRMRARLFQERGLIDVLDPREVSGKSLLERIMVDLERSDFPSSNAVIDTRGSANVADRLLELALDRRALRPLNISRPVAAAGPLLDVQPLDGMPVNRIGISPGFATRLVRGLEGVAEAGRSPGEFLERAGHRFVYASLLLALTALLFLLLSSSGPLRATTTADLYFAGTETFMSENDPVLIGEPAGNQVPIVAGAYEAPRERNDDGK